jgi:hypothetical protein
VTRTDFTNYEGTMTSFRDAAGREWNLTVTLHSLPAVRQAVGADPKERLTPERVFAGIVDGGPEAVSDLLWSLCEGQHPGVDRDAFRRGLDRDALDAGCRAAAEEAVLFVARGDRAAIRKRLAAVWDRLEQLAAQQLAEVSEHGA